MIVDDAGACAVAQELARLVDEALRVAVETRASTGCLASVACMGVAAIATPPSAQTATRFPPLRPSCALLLASVS